MASPTATSPLATGPRPRHPPSHLHMSLNANSPELAASMPNLETGDPRSGRAPNRLRKKRKDGPYLPVMDIPDHLKETKEEAGQEEDVRASRSGGGGMNMHQSIFGLIAAAGSRVDFQDRFEDEESEDEGESEGAGRGKSLSQHRRKDGAGRPLAVSHRHNSDGQQSRPSEKGDDLAKSEKKHRRKITDGIMRSVPVLKRLSSRSKRKPSKRDSMAESQILERDEPTDDDNEPRGRTMQLNENESDNDRHLQPVMSRMLEARAAAASRQSVDLERLSTATPTLGEAGTLSSAETTNLAIKLKEIFEFDEVEAVVDEYSCWLMQNVLLQGFMYITAKHICFYSYLPKKTVETAKAGYLAKSGKRNPKYSRYWFRLKGDVLSYYTDASNLYFPHGQIDLRYGISAEVTDKNKDRVHFSVVTAHRTYHFRADSAPSAKEWVKCLQRVIFRSHNDGDSVKISLPLANVIDIEDAPTAMEFADTAKIRVIDNDETFAIDEYFFSFFSRGSEAKNVLKVLIDAAHSEREEQADLQPRPAHRVPSDPTTKKLPKAMASLNISTRPEAHRSHSGKLHEGVKATLSPMSPTSASYNNSPRASGEYGRPSLDAFRQSSRRSLDLRALTDVPRRSFSSTRRSRSRHRLQDITADQEPARDPDPQGSSESYVQSMEDPSQASFSALVASSTDDPSASQILRGSDVFHSPTIHQRASSATRSKAEHQLDPISAQPHHQAQSMAVPIPGPRHAATTGHFAVAGDGDKVEQASPATPTLQNITKMGAYPLQRAAGFASYLNNQSRRMSNLLATESMGYVEKVHGMWKGGRKHYEDPTGLKTDDEAVDDDPVDRLASGHRFRAHFALPDSENLQAAYFGYIMRVLPLYGKIYISDRHFCFRSLLPGTRTKLVLPLQDIENANKEKGFRFGYSGLVLVIRGHEELFFEFSKAEIRDDCTVTLLQNLEHARLLPDNQMPDLDELDAAEFALAERDALKAATTPDERPIEDAMLLRNPSSLNNRDSPTMLFDDPKASFLNFKPPKPLRITCLTIGSRGDVQPYIALALGLMAEGHSVKIATHEEFQPWIEKYGIAFANVGGDPGELMRLCIENGTFTWAFLKEANAMFRGWLDELLVSTWSACQGSDLLIESPSAMAGIHIAEALGIPYFRAFTMPWTRTRAYPHPFIMPEHKMGGAYNLLSYSLFDTVFWRAMQSQINRWRRGTLGLPNTTLEKLQPNKVPFLYNFSPSFVPPPLDYSDWIHVTGYWFLDEGSDNTKAGRDAPAESTRPKDPEKQEPSQSKQEKKPFVPDAALVDFIAKARADDKKIVYVGFGSIIVPDVAKMTQEVIDAVLKADVRCILSKGWSEREDPKDKDKKKEDQSGGHLSEKSSHESAAAVKKPAPIMPAEILVIKSAPHDWLFAQIDAAAHHGGAGTTGASIRAGIPTIIRPFFGDQFFSGTRVEDLGVGIYLKKWGAASFARAMWEATHSHRMISRAAELGRQIRMENGVDTAIQCIYRDLEYARSLINAKVAKHKPGAAVASTNKQQLTHRSATTGSVPVGHDAKSVDALAEVPSSEYEAEGEDDDEEAEEAWTFVGADEVILEPETLLRRSTLLGPVQSTVPGILGRAELMAEQEKLDEKKGMSQEEAVNLVRTQTEAAAAAEGV